MDRTVVFVSVCSGLDHCACLEHRNTYANLLALAVSASLQLPHQMSMLSLLLRLGPASSRAGNIDTIFGHDREPRKSCLSSLLRADILLRFLGDTSAGGARSR